MLTWGVGTEDSGEVRLEMQHGCKICGRGNSPAEFCQVASRGEVTVSGARCSLLFLLPPPLVVQIQTVDVKTSSWQLQMQDGRYYHHCPLLE